MSQQGFASSGEASIYFETTGNGNNLVMIHVGVAGSQQWNGAFDHFQGTHKVLRYDMRGFGKSEPVAGKFRAIDDLGAVLSAAEMDKPLIMMGCSMGGSLAMDFTLTHPDQVAALIMVCSGPSGLWLDIEQPAKFKEVLAAEEAGDIDLVCELETQIWFDGESRQPGDVDPKARALLYEMNHQALTHDLRGLGERERDLEPAAYKRLGDINVPVLLITGALDIPYMAAAADYMQARIPDITRFDFPDAAHLPSMEHPARFNAVVEQFLENL